MARMIDADNIISVCEILSEKGNDPHYWNQLISIIKDVPAIDAIPVEWLEQQRDKRRAAAAAHSRISSMTVLEAINVVLELWAQEQEAR